jgi:hypothetical protein
MNGVASVDAMLGIINNASQTATIVDTQRNVADSLRAASERNLNALMQSLSTENQRSEHLANMNNAFINQNLANIGSALKDSIQTNATNQLSATERVGATTVGAVDRVGSILGHSLERIGSDNINATDRNGAANLITTERIGNTLSSLLNQNNTLLNTSIKEGQVTSERNFGESRLFNATQNQNLERRIGDYYLQAERNFHNINNDLLKVETSLGRLADNHHNANMMELLKVHAALDKSIDRSEMNLSRQAADNYANVQIEAAKNRLGLEQKISDIGNDIKLSIIKDNNETRNLINSYNNDNIRNDLQAERIIHALHHHYPHHHHHGHHDHHDRHHDHHDRHHDRHHHYYPPFFPYGGIPFQGAAVGGQQNGSPRN